MLLYTEYSLSVLIQLPIIKHGTLVMFQAHAILDYLEVSKKTYPLQILHENNEFCPFRRNQCD